MGISWVAPDGLEITAQQFRQANAATHGGGSGRRLGGRSGFRVDTPDNVLTVTGTTWTLGPISAMIDPKSTTHQGVYGWASSANITGSIDPPDETNARKDVIYIDLWDDTAGDGTGLIEANVKYLAGTPSTTPTAPTHTGFLVGTISVPKFGGGNPTVVLNPARYAAAGAPLPVFSQAERDAIPDKYDGLMVQRRDLPGNQVETFDGAEWSTTAAVQAASLVQVPDPGWVVSGIVTKTRVGNMTQVQLTGRVTRAVAAEINDTINKTILGIIPAGYRPSVTIDWPNNKLTSESAIVMHTNAFIAPTGDLTIKHDTTAYKMFPGDYWGLQASWWI